MTYAYPGDFDNKVYSTSFFAQASDLGYDHQLRLQYYQLYWDFYFGKQWTKAAPEGFDQVTINYAKAFVNKIRRFTFRTGWNPVFSDELIDKGVDKWVGDAWKNNNKLEITTRITQDGGIFGDWYVYVKWNPDYWTKGKGGIELSPIDPRFVYPEYNALTGEMQYCVVVIPYEVRNILNGKAHSKTYFHREIHTKESILVEEVDDDGQVTESSDTPNPIGKVLIIHGRNKIKAGSEFGESDIEDLIDSQKLFNEKVSDVSDILDYHAGPVTLIYGAKASKLEKGANKIWAGLPINAKVENLKSEGNISESMGFIDFIKTTMHEEGNVPVDAFGGKEKKISNTSAVALALEYEPLIEVAEDKRNPTADGLKKIDEVIMDIGAYMGEFSLEDIDEADRYEHDIEWGTLLPRDRSQDLEELQMELTMKLETKKGALIRLGVKDPETKLKELEEEAAEELERAREEMIMQAEANPQEQFAPKDQTKKAVNNSNIVHGEQETRRNVKEKS